MHKNLAEKKAYENNLTVDKISQQLYDTYNFVEKTFGKDHHFKFI